MTCGIKRIGDVNVVRLSIALGFKDIGDEDEPVYQNTASSNIEIVLAQTGNLLLDDGLQEFQARFALLLRVACLDSGRNQAEILPFGDHTVGIADHGDVDITLAVHLVLRNDDLHTINVLRILYRVIHDADNSNHL